MQPKTLKFKVVLYLTVALSAAMLFFTGMVAWYLYSEILGKVSDQLIQVSEVISRSTRFAMLQNQPAYVDRIINDVANHEGKIARVRIISNDGKVVFTTHAPELGQTDRPEGSALPAMRSDHAGHRAACPRRTDLDV